MREGDFLLFLLEKRGEDREKTGEDKEKIGENRRRSFLSTASTIGIKGTAAIFLISHSSGLTRPHLGSRLHVFTNQQGDHRPGCYHDDPRIPPAVLQVLRISSGRIISATTQEDHRRGCYKMRSSG